MRRSQQRIKRLDILPSTGSEYRIVIELNNGFRFSGFIIPGALVEGLT